MSLTAIQPNTAAYDAARSAGQTTRRSTSAAALDGFRLDQAASSGQGDDAQLKELTEMLVSTAFIMPMFEKMREDPLAANLFHGGRGEKVFRQQLDQVMADRISAASSLGLADALYNQFSRGNATGQTLETHG